MKKRRKENTYDDNINVIKKRRRKSAYKSFLKF
jgi:hypothetical protein